MRLIERLAENLGWSTDYYIVAESLEGNVKNTGSAVFKVSPWLTASNLNHVRDCVAENFGYERKNVVIVSITKL